MLLIFTFLSSFFFFIFKSFQFLIEDFDCIIFTTHFVCFFSSSRSTKLNLLLKNSNTFCDLVGIISFFGSVLIFYFITSAVIRFIFNQHEYFSSNLPKRSSLREILFSSLVFSIMNLMFAIIPELNLSLMMTVASTRNERTLKSSISISKVFKIHTSGSIICRIFLLLDMLPLFNIVIFLYHVHSVCNKDLECSCIISNVPQHNPDACSEIFIKFLQL